MKRAVTVDSRTPHPTYNVIHVTFNLSDGSEKTLGKVLNIFRLRT